MSSLDALDLFDTLARPEQLSDPYPFYDWLRANRPVHLDPDGTVYLSCYRDSALLKNPDIRDAAEGDGSSHTLNTYNQSLIKTVPPQHTDLRRMGAVAFDPDLLKRAGAQVRETAGHLADQVAEKPAHGDAADLHSMYSLPFTQRTAAIVFGIPDEDFDLLAALPGRMFSALYPKADPATLADADDASRALAAYVEDGLRRRRFTPDSGFDRLARMQDTASMDDLVRLCWLLWWASYTSSLAAIDLAVLTLLEHPHTIQALRERPDAWVKEALRYRSPHVINSANLTTSRPMTIGTVSVPAQTPVRFLISSMNRDPEAFPDADTFDPDRPAMPRHLTFGEGIHTCIGAKLARMELAIALTTLVDRIPDLALASAPVWRPYTTQRLVSSLLVTSSPTRN